MKYIIVICTILGMLSHVASAQQSNADAINTNNVGVGVNAGSNAGNYQIINSNAIQQPPSVGLPGVASHSAPAVFQILPNNYGMPAEITGMALEVFYDQKCRPEEVDGGESRVLSEKGESKLTLITITTHPRSAELMRGDKPPKVRTDLSGDVRRYRCLGIVTAITDKSAMEKGTPVGLSVLMSDIRRSVRSKFMGVQGDVIVLSSTQYWGGALGVTSGSSGMSFGASLVNFVSRVTTGGLAPGFASGNGASAPSGRGGITAMILVEVLPSDPNGIDIGLAEVGSPFGTTQAPVGGNGKKAEADKK